MFDLYRRLSSGRHTISYTAVIDEDDRSMNNPQVLERLRKFARVHIGTHKSKVEACNAGVERGHDVLLLASDDMTPICRNWDDVVASDMRRHFPNFDGGLWYNDGHQRDVLCTYPIMGINLFKKFGYFYDPAYQSFSCDAEYTLLVRAMGRLPYSDRVLFRHDHESFGGIPKDGLYRRNEPLMPVDAEVIHKRMAIQQPGSQFQFNWPPIRLSILIPSLAKRDHMLRRLLDTLNHEINGNDIIREVEIVVDVDNGERSVGVKRQRLLERAIGHYVCFVDDDDRVDPHYCRRIINILRAGTPDCIGLIGMITQNGGPPQKFIHSTKNHKPGWFEENGVYYRNPNHLNTIRRDIALKVGYKDMRSGEDHDFSMRLEKMDLIKTEAVVEEGSYFYDCVSHK